MDSLFDAVRSVRIVMRRAGREPGVDHVSRPPLPLGLRKTMEFMENIINHLSTSLGVLGLYFNKIQSGAATCSEGLVTCFLRVPHAAGLYCCCHADQANKGNMKKQTSEQVAAPDCIKVTSVTIHKDEFNC